MTTKSLRKQSPLLATAWAMLLFVQTSQAHFPWLDIEKANTAQPVLQCYFGESPEPDDPALLDFIEKSSLWCLPGKGDAVKLDLVRDKESLHYVMKQSQVQSHFFLKRDLGEMTRHGKTFELRYYAFTGPGLSSPVWKGELASRLADLIIIPKFEKDKLSVTVKFKGKEVSGAEVIPFEGLGELEKLTTNEKGQVSFDLTKASINAVRVKVVEEAKKAKDGTKTGEIRHYGTVTFPVVTAIALKTTTPYAEIPETVTSFGAAIIQDDLYYYGGHIGSAHKYSTTGQANTLWKLNLKSGDKWQEFGKGYKAQGLAMVACQEKLYRIGGFTAKNLEGDKHDLWSQNNFASYDPTTNQWKDLPPLPEPRSSFDAVVLDNKIYVIGGWSMQGEKNSTWHNTAWSFDVSNASSKWVKLPTPGFAKRALSVASHKNKIYAIGGMKEKGPTVEVAVFDIKSQTWSKGPYLCGGSMAGFGTSAFELNGQLYVSTFEGSLQKLSEKTNQWEVVGKFPEARFFHRMLPYEKSKLILLGGANMGIGKFEEVEILDLKSGK